MEIWTIEKYKPEYNIAKGGTGGATKWGCTGKHWKLSDSTKNKMKESWHKTHLSCNYYSSLSGKKNKGKHWYNNGKVNVTAFECPDGFFPGKLPMSGEKRKNMGKWNKGRKLSEEHKKALKEGFLQKCENNPKTGRFQRKKES